jgi:hypothetical protein
MTDLVLLYPNRDNDLIALAATKRSSGTGAVNYAAIAGYTGKMIAGGLSSAMRKGRRGFDRVIEWLIDNTEVDQDFLDTLGRQNTPYWGSDEWNRTIAPAGYVNRFDAAADTVVLGIGFLLARVVLGRVSIGSIASFAGGQYGNYQTRKYRHEIHDALTDIADDTSHESPAGKLNNLQDHRLDATTDLAYAIADAFRSNDRTKLSRIVRDVRSREETLNIDL